MQPTSDPLITVVIPTYRRPSLLRRAIASVLIQRHPYFQVQVYDNASGDETEAVVTEIQKSDDRIKYFRHPENLGLVGNITHGIAHVTTPYFSILSDDDMLAPDFFSVAMEAFTRYPNASLCLTDAIRVDKWNRILTGPLQPELTGDMTYYGPGEGFIPAAKGVIPTPWVGTMFRREVAEQIGLPNRNAGPAINDNFVLRALARLPCVACASLGCVIMENTESVGYSMSALDAQWPAWWTTTAEDIERDKLVAEPIRSQARALIVPDFRKMAVRQALQGLGRFGISDARYARQAAKGAKECGFAFTGMGLGVLIAAYEKFEMIRKLVDRAALARKQRTSTDRELLEKRYAEHVKFLEKFGSPAETSCGIGRST